MNDTPLEPNTFLLDPAHLIHTRLAIQADERWCRRAARVLQRKADRLASTAFPLLTDKATLPPSGDARDFFSIGTYWWPNPDNSDGLPYVRRDGHINPESMDSDTGRIRRLCQDCRILGLAWWYFQDTRYSHALAKRLRAWFLHPSTAMHPNLRYAQSIPGITAGRSFGVIDTRDLRHLVDSASLVLGSSHWGQGEHAQLREWCCHFLTWLLDSDLGKRESRANNNHGTWYNAQVLSLALFTGQLRLARQLAHQGLERLDAQINAVGEQPEEFCRSRPLTYCTMNLHAFVDVATLAEAVDVDVWGHQNAQGASLGQAFDWLYAYVSMPKRWPAREIIPYQPLNYLSVFRRAAWHYGEHLDPENLPLDSKTVISSRVQLMYPPAKHQHPGRATADMAAATKQQQIAQHWNTVAKRTRWWHTRTIIEEINRRVCGQRLPRISQGATEVLKSIAAGRVFRHGVSVGAGSASKEMALLKEGIVERFTVYELSDERIRSGRRSAKRNGLQDRIDFIEGDAFKNEVAAGSFDFVHWNNALHHMFDVDAAVAWSKRVLSDDGLFFMDDYVGPNRFQWSDATLSLASKIRSSLPEDYLQRENDPEQRVPVEVGRPSVKRIVNEDPSEAPDSSAIMSAVDKHFPGAFVIRTGGAVYNLALTHTLHHFDEDNETDRERLRHLMLLDEMALSIPGVDNHYAVAMAWKNGKSIKVPRPEWRVGDPVLADHSPRWVKLARKVLPASLRAHLNSLNAGRQTLQKQVRKQTVKLVGALTPAPEPEFRVDKDGSHFCPLCQQTVTGFGRGGHHGRPGAKCPGCGSLERHRVAWLYLQDNAKWLANRDNTVRFLHVAPEAPLQRLLSTFKHIEYISADIEPGRAMLTMDLTAIDQPDDQYDVIFCSHVLEHIPDDVAAMREMKRVLKPGGVAYIQIPMKGKSTYEDWSITAPEARREAFGQEDHVRMYGTDILGRLKAAGFQAEIIYPAKRLSGEEKQRMNTGNRPLIVCQ